MKRRRAKRCSAAFQRRSSSAILMPVCRGRLAGRRGAQAQASPTPTLQPANAGPNQGRRALMSRSRKAAAFCTLASASEQRRNSASKTSGKTCRKASRVDLACGNEGRGRGRGRGRATGGPGGRPLAGGAPGHGLCHGCRTGRTQQPSPRNAKTHHVPQAFDGVISNSRILISERGQDGRDDALRWQGGGNQSINQSFTTQGANRRGT